MSIPKKINIFIVDDNKVFALALKADIEETFFAYSPIVQLFETGEKCIEKFKVELPEIVILDYNLNTKHSDAMNGVKVLEVIKKVDPETNVIMLTSEDDLDIALKSFHIGASDYVVKSETQFRKINYSLLNLLKMMEATDRARKYKQMASVLLFSIVAVIGAIIAKKVCTP